MSVTSMDFGAGMAWLISVTIYFTVFCLLHPNKIEGKVGFGSAKRAITSLIN